MDTVPDVTLTRPDGSPLKLRDLPRPLVVYFYPKDNTSGCTREAQDFSALAGEFAAAGVTLLGVSMYGKKYMGIERSTFLVAADGSVAQAWRKVKVPGHADVVLAAAKAL